MSKGRFWQGQTGHAARKPLSSAFHWRPSKEMRAKWQGERGGHEDEKGRMIRNERWRGEGRKGGWRRRGRVHKGGWGGRGVWQVGVVEGETQIKEQQCLEGKAGGGKKNKNHEQHVENERIVSKKWGGGRAAELQRSALKRGRPLGFLLNEANHVVGLRWVVSIHTIWYICEFSVVKQNSNDKIHCVNMCSCGSQRVDWRPSVLFWGGGSPISRGPSCSLRVFVSTNSELLKATCHVTSSQPEGLVDSACQPIPPKLKGVPFHSLYLRGWSLTPKIMGVGPMFAQGGHPLFIV